jgi:hypothetical protein
VESVEGALLPAAAATTADGSMSTARLLVGLMMLSFLLLSSNTLPPPPCFGAVTLVVASFDDAEFTFVVLDCFRLALVEVLPGGLDEVDVDGGVRSDLSPPFG